MSGPLNEEDPHRGNDADLTKTSEQNTTNVTTPQDSAGVCGDQVVPVEEPSKEVDSQGYPINWGNLSKERQVLYSDTRSLKFPRPEDNPSPADKKTARFRKGGENGSTPEDVSDDDADGANEFLDELLEKLESRTEAEKNARWEPREVELDSEGVKARVCKGQIVKGNQLPPFVDVRYNGESASLALTAHSGDGGHRYLHLVCAKCLLIGMPRDAVLELLLSVEFIFRDGDSGLTALQVARSEIDHELDGFFNRDGTFNSKLEDEIDYLISGARDEARAGGLLAKRLGEPVCLANRKPAEVSWKGSIRRTVVKLATAEPASFEAKVCQLSPAEVLAPIFGDATLCVLNGKKGTYSTPLTSKGIGDLPGSGKELEYYVPKSMNPAPWTTTSGEPWRQDDEAKSGHSLKTNPNFPRWPTHILTAEYDTDPWEALTKKRMPGEKATKADVQLQWKIITWVSDQLGQRPLYVCRSAQKGDCSLHTAWDCRSWSEDDCKNAYRLLIAAGFDPVSANHSQKMRVPGGTRRGGRGTQTIVYHQDVLETPATPPEGFKKFVDGLLKSPGEDSAVSSKGGMEDYLSDDFDETAEAEAVAPNAGLVFKLTDEGMTWLADSPDASEDLLIRAAALNEDKPSVVDAIYDRLKAARAEQDTGTKLTKTEFNRSISAKKKVIKVEKVKAANAVTAATATEWRESKFMVKLGSIDNAVDLGLAMAATGRFFIDETEQIFFRTRQNFLVKGTPLALAGNIQQWVYTFRVDHDSTTNESKVTPQKIDEKNMKLYLACDDLRRELPIIKRRVTTASPHQDKDGKWVLLPPGYDSKTGFFVEAHQRVIDDEMTLDEAKDVLKETCKGIAFKSDRDRATYLSHGFTMLMRPGLSVHGPVVMPAFIYRANQSRLGKDVAAKRMILAVTQSFDPLVAFKDIPKEKFQERWELAAGAGKLSLHSENNKDLARCTDVVEAMLTADYVSRRTLYTSDVVKSPNLITLSFSANVGFEITTDMSRRCRAIILEDGRDIGEISKERRTDVDAWIRASADRVLSAMLAVVRSWDEAGCPTPKDSTFATGYAYPEVIAGLVMHCGYENPAKDDPKKGTDEVTNADIGRSDWEELLVFLHEGMDHFTPTENGGWLPTKIADFVLEYNRTDGKMTKGLRGKDADLAGCLDGLEKDNFIEFSREYAGELLGAELGRVHSRHGTERPERTMIGMLIRRHAGTWFGDYELSIIRENNEPKRVIYGVIKRT